MKWIRRLVTAVLLVVFLGSAGTVGTILFRYQSDSRFYRQAAEDYTARVDVQGTDSSESTEKAAEGEVPPITVDFSELQKAGEDIIGWIYCEGTVINYPVLQGEDNMFYLHHSYDGASSMAGSIFVDSDNLPGFADANTIIYGHHMKDKSMFATLEYWADQEYYEEHPVMWLLTPEQNYKIVLFSGYNTPAVSDTYTIFPDPGKKMDDYLQSCAGKSDFKADVALDKEGHYVLLSTCAYVFDNARYVLHGMLVPVGGAGA